MYWRRGSGTGEKLPGGADWPRLEWQEGQPPTTWYTENSKSQSSEMAAARTVLRPEGRRLGSVLKRGE